MSYCFVCFVCVCAVYEVKPVALKKKYSIGHKIGTGGFAVVRECKIRKGWKDQTLFDGASESKDDDGKDKGNKKQLYALKVINKTNLQKDDLVILESEVAVMRLVE